MTLEAFPTITLDPVVSKKVMVANFFLIPKFLYLIVALNNVPELKGSYISHRRGRFLDLTKIFTVVV